MFLPFRASWQKVIRPSTSFPPPPLFIPYGGFSLCVFRFALVDLLFTVARLNLSQLLEIFHVKIVQRRRSSRKQDEGEEDPSFFPGDYHSQDQVEEGKRGEEPGKRLLQFRKVRFHH